MIETWKDISGYNGEYQVSNLGRVRSFKKNGIKIKIPQDNMIGYLKVALWKNNRRRCYYIHVLVAKAFVDNPEGKPEVDHKDRDRQNNRWDNLQWLTRTENMKKIHNDKNKMIFEDPYEELDNPFEIISDYKAILC